jgi:hypothetical protein
MKRKILELKDYIGTYTENCPITLHEIIVPVVTECNHVFEKDALQNWIQQSIECPVCRKVLNVIDENDKKVEPRVPIIVNILPTRQVIPRYILEFTPTNSSSSLSSSSSSTPKNSERVSIQRTESLSSSSSPSDHNNETSSSDDEL